MTIDRPQPRKEPITEEERLFDLIPAAWGMDDVTFEKVAGFPEGWMWKWRNHYLAPTPEQVNRIRRLAIFHDGIRLTYTRAPDYASWWRNPWGYHSFIGDRSPLQAVLTDGDAFLDQAERYFWLPD
jgi:hypothetical protein